MKICQCIYNESNVNTATYKVAKIKLVKHKLSHNENNAYRICHKYTSIWKFICWPKL